MVVQDGRVNDLLGELSVSPDHVVDGGTRRVCVQDGRIDDLLSDVLDGISDVLDGINDTVVVLFGGLSFFGRHVLWGAWELFTMSRKVGGKEV